MLLRQVIALAFVAALTAACYALFFEHAPASAAFVAVAALAGALAGGAFVAVGRRGRGASVHETLSGADDAEAAGEEGPSLMVAGELPAGTLLEATMQSMREGVLVVDGALRVVASNNAARALLTDGLPAGEGPRRLTEVTRDSSIHDAFASALQRGARTEARFEAQSLGYVPLPLELVDQIKGYWRRSFAAGLSFFLTRQGDQQERPSPRICGCRK